jgi:phosphoribosylformylglycinamidine synthase
LLSAWLEEWLNLDLAPPQSKGDSLPVFFLFFQTVDKTPKFPYTWGVAAREKFADTPLDREGRTISVSVIFMARIYVQSAIADARAKLKKKQFEALGIKNKIGAVYLADCYAIDAKLDKKQLEKAKSLLANPLTQKADVNSLTIKKFNYAIEIGFLPGVTDNVGHTAKETLIDGARVKFKPGQNVYSSQVFFISGNVSRGDINKIASSLYNPLIQRATIITAPSSHSTSLLLPLIIPKVKIKASNKVVKINLNISDDELTKLGKLGILNGEKRQGPLALSLEELKAIKEYFNKVGRQPTDIELETLAQTWSEHCKHTIFADPMDELKNGIYKTYIKAATVAIRKQKASAAKSRTGAGATGAGGDFCVSVFTDNAGGISFDNTWVISHKVETHNTPSALDPFGGAITGIGGVNRDAIGFGLGAKPIANFYGFCLADPNDKTKLYRDKNLEQPMLSSRRIMDGVIAGINAGGNQSGIPTPLGFLFFDERFRGKPLVFAGTLGLSPKKIGNHKGWEKQALPGDLIVMVGGKVGLDGIHGATFSSEGLDTHSPAAAVQIGDPITQKKLSDAIVKEARDQNLFNSITDCGAGGISGGVGEMARESGGCNIFLDKVPLKYPGLSPWQIWISESQERMVLAVPPKKWAKFEKLMKSRGVDATIIGKFKADGKCTIQYNGKTVLDVDMEFLHNGRPKKNLLTKRSVPIYGRPVSPINRHATFSDDIFKLLSRLNITSTEFVNEQYDHEVQGSSILKPLQGRGKVNADAAVIRPVLTSKKGVITSYGLNPNLSEIDPYAMAAASIDSAIRAAVAAGADIDYLALLDNFCWCSPEDPKRLYQLKEAARACFEVATDFGTPFISGKDSMHNDFKGFGADGKNLKISIPPTLLITTVGVVPDVTKTISLDVKIAGDLLYILGETNNEMAGSEYLAMMKNEGGLAPKVDTHKNYKLYKSVFNCNQQDLIASAISINRGGLVTALTKTLIAGGLGAEINLTDVPGNWKENYQALFSESQGRILVSVAPRNAEKFEQMINGNAFAKIGKVINKPTLTIIDKNDKKIVNLNTNQALKNYKATFKDY